MNNKTLQLSKLALSLSNELLTIFLFLILYVISIKVNIKLFICVLLDLVRSC